MCHLIQHVCLHLIVVVKDKHFEVPLHTVLVTLSLRHRAMISGTVGLWVEHESLRLCRESSMIVPLTI